MPTKIAKTKPKPPAPTKAMARTPAHTVGRRTTPDQRWQRTMRFNWDKGGSKGGRR